MCSNRIQVSSSKKPMFFYVNLAKASECGLQLLLPLSLTQLQLGQRLCSNDNNRCVHCPDVHTAQPGICTYCSLGVFPCSAYWVSMMKCTCLPWAWQCQRVYRLSRSSRKMDWLWKQVSDAGHATHRSVMHHEVHKKQLAAGFKCLQPVC